MLDGILNNPEILLFIPVFLFSLSVHECAHAFAANWSGDMLSTYQGRLTLNPISHIDPIGTILVPVLMIVSSGGTLFFGWAKPVPVNPLAYRKPWYELLVSGAGPASNGVLAIIFLIVLIICQATGLLENDPKNLFSMLIFSFIHLNVLLMFFNLLPIPPLDGSHILMHLIYHKPWGRPVITILEQFGFMLFILFIITPASNFFFKFVFGVTRSLYNFADFVTG